MPTDDRGDDIDVRMDDVFLGGSTCEVPAVLLNPYPDDALRRVKSFRLARRPSSPA